MEPVDGEPWPVGRAFHAACCIHYGEDNPQLLIHGGLDDNNTVHNDMWVLDVGTGKWTEVSVSQFSIALVVHIIVCMFTQCR